MCKIIRRVEEQVDERLVTECVVCGGELEYMDSFGRLDYYRCPRCHTVHHNQREHTA